MSRSRHCLLIPCLLASMLLGGALYGRGVTGSLAGRAGHEAVDPGTGKAAGRADGPWGRLTWRAATISPPADRIASIDPVAERRPWIFERTSRRQLAEFFVELGLNGDQLERLFATGQRFPPAEGFRLMPSPELVRSLTPAQRRRLYNRLSQSAWNPAQQNAFRFAGPSVDQWFEGSGLSAAVREEVSRYIYRNDGLLFFADLAFVLPSIETAEQRRRLVQTLSRESSLRLTLHVPAGADPTPLADYWSGPTGSEPLLPLFSELAHRPEGGAIEVAALLPPFARRRVDTYPTPDAAPLAPGASRDCHWTALNFFNDPPDDRLAETAAVQRELTQRYEPVRDTPRFGDLVLFESEGRIFHSAVYIAADVLFTKNGPRFSRPWMFMHRSDVEAFYPREHVVTVRYLRLRPGRLTHFQDTARTDRSVRLP